ncbi:protein rep [Solimonas marina]|uniref:Protein rep n=1 Tax=Solimonas marina TaxID=2714601 RepID=A0A969WDH7_9GAMM|nr:protein rep [Solimonas marina]NKF24583.1 protein rep [Solimonas marina]
MSHQDETHQSGAPTNTLVSITNCVHASASDTSSDTPTNCVYTSASQSFDDETAAKREARQRRYELQRTAATLLRDVPHPRGREWRTVRCLLHFSGEAVAVRYSPSIARASFAGACVCGSVWVCPVCSARICELRRIEIAAAHTVHAAAGGSALFVTLTTPHDISDELSALLGNRRKGGLRGLAGAMKRFRNDRQVKKLVESLGRVGFIRATEITRGANGWHPHFHELWLTDCPQDDRIRVHATEVLLNVWKRVSVMSGLDEPNARGVDLRWSWDASEYLSKIGHEQTWGSARELASAATKRGRKTSRNAWQLLRAAGDGDRDAAEAFSEFAQATLGQRQLVWARGLKAALAIEDRTDEELARHVDEDSFVMSVIPANRWRALLRLPYEWRAQVLDVAENGGPHAVSDFLDLLEVNPSQAREFVRILLEV